MSSKPSNRFLSIVLACAVAAFAAAQDADSQPASRAESAPADKVAAIQQEYEAAMKAFSAAYRAADSDEAKKKIAEENYPKAEKWFPRLFEIAKAKDPAAVKALVWILKEEPDSKEGREALGILGRDHAASADLVGACDALSYSVGRETEDFLRAAMKSSPHELVRARAAYMLAQVAKRSANLSRRIADPSDPEDQKNIAKWYEGRTDYLASIDAAKYDKEAEDLLVGVKEKHGALEAAWGGTLGARAEGDLFEIRKLAIGKVAPEISGEDLFGKALKLSDFAGKVVVLDFWGHWWGPCRAMYPHERSLVKRLADKPFALVGINSDEDRYQLKETLEKESITWPSFWNDGGTAGGIAKTWNVHSWPTIYVLDHKGVIRFKNKRGPALDKAVDKLLEEMAAETRPSK